MLINWMSVLCIWTWKPRFWPQLWVEFCLQFFVDVVMLRFVSRYSWVVLRPVPLQDTVSLYFLVTSSMLVGGVFCGFWYILTSFKWSSCCKKGRVNAAVDALKSRFRLKCQNSPTNCQISRSKSWSEHWCPKKSRYDSKFPPDSNTILLLQACFQPASEWHQQQQPQREQQHWKPGPDLLGFQAVFHLLFNF